MACDYVAGSKTKYSYYIERMNNHALFDPKFVRAEKQRVAALETSQALAQYRAESIAMRENMKRLRALRLGKEKEESAQATAPAKKSTSRSKKSTKTELSRAAQQNDLV